MLIGSVCQWVHSYLKCALAGFCSGFKIYPNRHTGLLNKMCVSSLCVHSDEDVLAARCLFSLSYIRGEIYLNYSLCVFKLEI